MWRDAGIDDEVPRGCDGHLGALDAMIACGSRGFEEGRQPNADEGLVRLLLPGSGAPVWVVEQLQSPLHALRIVAGVIGEASGRLIGKGVRRNEVASTDLD